MSIEVRNWAWQRLRLLRSAPPHLAARFEPRARVLAAALEQAEQLARSAETVGTAAQPLPLFYAMSQAGRAITAAHLPERWELTSHGLRWPGAAASSTGILHRIVEPRPGSASSYHRVAEAVRSSAITAPVQLGAVWSAIPELALPALPEREPDWLPPLSLQMPSEGYAPMMMTGVVALVHGLPDIDTAAAIEAHLEHYPTACDGRVDVLPSEPPRVMTESLPWLPDPLPRILWEGASATVQDRAATLDRVAPPCRSRTERYALPRLSTGDHLSVLMLWWTLLFGLSNLARHEPAVWTAALDLNKSPLAVPIESALSEALDSLPHLVLEALVGGFVERHTY